MLEARSPALATVIAAVCQWPGVEVVPHCFGGSEFRLGHNELGHLHADGTLDLPFSVALRDCLIDEGWAAMHHVLPASGWVTFHVATDVDVTHALKLLRIAYLRRRLRLASDDREAIAEVARMDASPELLATLLDRRSSPTSVTLH